jgi:anti-sigma regulatory factor (Ser/Thr protein kinase)
VPTNPAAFDVRSVLRHGLQVVGFSCVLALIQLASGIERWGTWDNTLVYSLAIGLSIWASIEFGRLAVVKADGSGDRWPPVMYAVMAVGTVGGFFVGSLIGDWYCDCYQSIFRMPPVKLRSTLMFTLGASSIACYFFFTRGRAAAQRERLAKAERDATLAKLGLLQSQLEPHMLFNTLANLRVLISLDPPRAQAMLDRLIAFLRATLTASRTQAHSLASEFDRLDDYLQLMAMRMGPRLQARFDLPDDLRQVEVPPLLLQPLVENSIQHGLEPKVEGGRIEVAARREGDELLLTVLDTGVGLDAAPASNGTKFGLKQVRERLQTLFGDAGSLVMQPVDEAEGGGTRAVVRLPLRRAGAAVLDA